jgi:bifunctional non-homologous end joining protein LigD
MLHVRLAPLAISKMALSSPPPRRTRFGAPLPLSKAHWVRPEPVAEITYLGWTARPSRFSPVAVGYQGEKSHRDCRAIRPSAPP